jgi:hypothetical protein
LSAASDATTSAVLTAGNKTAEAVRKYFFTDGLHRAERVLMTR